MTERLTITIETGNAAFEDCPATELARILRDYAARLEQGAIGRDFPLRDINGNRVGAATIARAK